MSLKLTGLTFGDAPRIPGLRSGDLITLDCSNPAAPLKDWRILVRGQSVFFVSPPGWNNRTQTSPKDRDPKGPVVVHQVPLNEVKLQWESDEHDIETVIKGTSKHESMPLGWKPLPVEPAKSILEQIPSGQVGDA